MGELTLFAYQDHQLRTVIVDGEPWFVAGDVARILGYRMASDMTRRLDSEDRGTRSVRTPSGEQDMTIISEPGLYQAVLGSQVLGANDFKRWVTHDVLPSIRRTGRYETAAPPRQFRLPGTFAEALRLAADQAEAIEQQGRQIAELEPRAAQADHYRLADGLYAVASFANDLQAWAREHYGVKILHDDVRDFLGDIGLIIRGDTVRNNEPKAEAIKAGLVRQKHSTYQTNTRGTRATTSARLTPKGWGYAWDKATTRIADHGDLGATRQVATR